MAESFSDMVARVYMDAVERSERETPVMQWDDWWPVPRKVSYRESLTQPRKNIHGQVIPQKTLMLNRLRTSMWPFGKPKHTPRLPE